MASLTWKDVEPKLEGISPSMFHPSLAKVLFEKAQALPDGANLLEIGPYKGYSTCALAYGCVDTLKHLWTIDTFQGNSLNTNLQDGRDYFAEFWHNVTARGLEDVVTPLIGRSEKYYALWRHDLDLLFVDGSHDLSIVRADLAAFFPSLKRGGVLLMHDVYAEDVPTGNTAPVWMNVSLELRDCHGLLNLAWGVKV